MSNEHICIQCFFLFEHQHSLPHFTSGSGVNAWTRHGGSRNKAKVAMALTTRRDHGFTTGTRFPDFDLQVTAVSESQNQ